MMLDIKCHMNDLISKPHVYNCHIYQIRKFKIYIFSFILPIWMFVIVFSVRCELKIILDYSRISRESG